MSISRFETIVRELQSAGHVPQCDRPFALASSVAPPALPEEIDAAWLGNAPPELITLWRTTRNARLFEDTEFGQWGLEILDPSQSKVRTEAERKSRPQDLMLDDIVVAQFLGDQELLVLSPSENGCRRVLVALPLDPRADWHGVAPSLLDFLAEYLKARGDKYWEF